MPVSVGSPQTLYDKVLSAHVVDEKLDGTILLYIGKFASHPLHPRAKTKLCGSSF
jgi:3-isopropylmalate dehydratase